MDSQLEWYGVKAMTLYLIENMVLLPIFFMVQDCRVMNLLLSMFGFPFQCYVSVLLHMIRVALSGAVYLCSDEGIIRLLCSAS